MKKLIAIILSAFMLCPAMPFAAFGGGFSDLSDEKWYSEGISFCVANGYMSGVGEGLFDPAGELSRAMLVTILARLDGTELGQYGQNGSFADVSAGSWYAPSVEWAADNGITSGIGRDEQGRAIFGHRAAVTREQLALFLYGFSAYLNRQSALTEVEPAPPPSIDGPVEDMPIEPVGTGLTVTQAYDEALAAAEAIPDHRDIGELQSETQEIILLEGQYYQSYVASTHDMRYIFVASADYEMYASWDWLPIGTRDDYSLDDLGKISEDMSGDRPINIDLTQRAELSRFDDAALTHDWARDAMEWAVAAGLISGKAADILDPLGNCTRAEAAVMIRAYLLVR